MFPVSILSNSSSSFSLKQMWERVRNRHFLENLACFNKQWAQNNCYNITTCVIAGGFIWHGLQLRRVQKYTHIFFLECFVPNAKNVCMALYNLLHALPEREPRNDIIKRGPANLTLTPCLATFSLAFNQQNGSNQRFLFFHRSECTIVIVLLGRTFDLLIIWLGLISHKCA